MTAPAAALGLTPLTWPSDPRPDAADRRWAHRLLHGLAVELDHAAHAHTLLAALLNDLHDPPAEHRRLTQRLQAVDHAAVPAHDTADLLDRLDRHGPPDAAAELRRAHHHRLTAVAAIRAIVDLDRLGVLDTAVVPPASTAPSTCSPPPAPPSPRPTPTCSPPCTTSTNPRRRSATLRHSTTRRTRSPTGEFR